VTWDAEKIDKEYENGRRGCQLKARCIFRDGDTSQPITTPPDLLYVRPSEIEKIPRFNSISSYPGRREKQKLCSKPYWRRVWIMQEVGAATQLQVRWEGGSEGLVWGYLLVNLMEPCKESLCEEPRDKGYGCVGIAHDCQDGSLPIDYSKSLLELYEDVILFQYRAVKLDEKTIVHFSQLVQRLLGGPRAMLEDLARSRPGNPNPLSATYIGEDGSNIFNVIGVYGGRIYKVGPSYDDIVGIPDATWSWNVLPLTCQADLKVLREKNEGFMKVLLELGNSDLEKICPIDPQFSWKGSKEMLLNISNSVDDRP
jgi:hypothetical protein